VQTPHYGMMKAITLDFLSKGKVMKNAILYSSALVLLLAFVSRARAADQSKSPDTATVGPQSVVYDASSAFEFLKTLAGNWERVGGDHDHGGDSKAVIFKVTAAGSSVMETIFPGEAVEMISMYHKDGDDLLLTHYCALQNAPIMKFQKSDKPGEIKFVFHGGTNFDPKTDTHVHEGVMRIKDANTIESNFVAYSDGKPGDTPKGVLKRKTAK
jgi:calcineurin-like phosphoesterase family protein